MVSASVCWFRDGAGMRCAFGGEGEQVGGVRADVVVDGLRARRARRRELRRRSAGGAGVGETGFDGGVNLFRR